MRVILGSKSPGRKGLLKKVVRNFTVMDPNIDEKAIRDPNTKKLVRKLAIAKAQALLPRIKKPAILITADQVVECNNKILEKPKNIAEAKRFLRLYAKHPAKTINGITVTNTLTKKQKTGTHTSIIYFHPIPEKAIKELAIQEHALNCAGGFSILKSPILNSYIMKILGTIDSITGLPIKLTKRLISEVK